MSDLPNGLAPLMSHQATEEPVASPNGATPPSPILSLVTAHDPYLLTKVTVPPVRVSALPRSSLLALLEHRVPLILLSAGAGYGKTTLLSTWVNTHLGQVAWLTLEKWENEPLRFWTYVLLACCVGVPSLAENASAWLTAIDTVPLHRTLASLLNALSERSEPLTLILDDYQVIEEPSIHQSLAFLLAHAPACLSLVLATRTDPPLQLSRLRVRGHLVEIREAQLRLSENEAGQFLAQTMGLTLSETDAKALWLRTEGWVAGLQLAALVLRSHADPSLQIQRINGSHLFLLEYVQEDILANVERATQTFLLCTSILTQMTAALCTAVTGEETSQDRLLALERTNLFVVPQDMERHWYRMHPLVREALLARLRAHEPELFLCLHQRAAHWYVEQQLFSEAIAHALSANDVDLASDLIERCMVPQSWRNTYHTLRGFLARLPKTQFEARPQLCLFAAQALFMTTPIGTGSMPAVEAHLQMAWQGYHRRSDQVGVGCVLAFRAMLLAFQGYFSQAFTLARESLSLLPEADVQWRGHGLSLLGMQALMEGELQLAYTLLQQADTCHEASGLLGGRQFVALMRAEVSLAQGNRVRATHEFRQVLGLVALHQEQVSSQLTDTFGNRRTHFEQAAWYGLAALAYEANQLQEAQQTLEAALVEGQFALISVQTPGLLLQVRMHCQRGEDTSAQALLEKYLSYSQPPEMVRMLQFCQAYLAFHRGDLGQVASWATGRSTHGQLLSRARTLEEVLLLARLHIAQNQPEEAIRQLAPQLEEAQAQGHGDAFLHLLVLQALASRAAGRVTQAKKMLVEAVTRACPAGYMRLFLEEGEVMAHLLQEVLSLLHQPELCTYVHALLQAATSARSPHAAPVQQAPHQLLEPLTPQEQRVLRLLAEGASNQQIASVLVIGRSTVKKHVSNLLGKLQVKNRTQAIVRARSWNLLEGPISERNS